MARRVHFAQFSRWVHRVRDHGWVFAITPLCLFEVPLTESPTSAHRYPSHILSTQFTSTKHHQLWDTKRFRLQHRRRTEREREKAFPTNLTQTPIGCLFRFTPHLSGLIQLATSSAADFALVTYLVRHPPYKHCPINGPLLEPTFTMPLSISAQASCCATSVAAST